MRLLSLVLLTACDPAAHCDLHQTALDLAGAGAADCGLVPLGDAGTTEWGCAADALEAGTPFVIRFGRDSIDSAVTGAFASTGTTVWLLQQDSLGAPPNGIQGWECVEPVAATDTGGGEAITCGSTAPQGNHYAVCGTCGADQCQPEPLPFPG